MEIKLFNNPEFGEIRTTQVEGKVMFCGKDIAGALGYLNSRDALAKHCKEKGVVNCDTLTDGGVQSMKFIDEGNVYRLIVRSKLPSVERFESWVFDEVLPSIRETGGYIAGEDELKEDELVIRAMEILKAKIAKKAAENKQLTIENKNLEIKLDESKEWYTVKRFKKEYNILVPWKALKDKSRALGYEIKKSFDSNYGEINSYNKKVFEIVLEELNFNY